MHKPVFTLVFFLLLSLSSFATVAPVTVDSAGVVNNPSWISGFDMHPGALTNSLASTSWVMLYVNSRGYLPATSTNSLVDTNWVISYISGLNLSATLTNGDNLATTNWVMSRGFLRSSDIVNLTTMDAVQLYVAGLPVAYTNWVKSFVQSYVSSATTGYVPYSYVSGLALTNWVATYVASKTNLFATVTQLGVVSNRINAVSNIVANTTINGLHLAGGNIVIGGGTNSGVSTLAEVLAAANLTGGQLISGESTPGALDGAQLSLYAGGGWLGSSNWAHWVGLDGYGLWGNGVTMLTGAGSASNEVSGGLFVSNGKVSDPATYRGNNGTIDVRGSEWAYSGYSGIGNGGYFLAKGGGFSTWLRDGAFGGSLATSAGGVDVSGGGNYDDDATSPPSPSPGGGGYFLAKGGNVLSGGTNEGWNAGYGGVVDVSGGHTTTNGRGLDGGSIITTNGGGSINTTAGYMGLGKDGERTTLHKSSTSNVTVTLPSRSGQLALKDEVGGSLDTNAVLVLGDGRWLPTAYSNYVASTYLHGGQNYTIITNAPWLTAETDWHFASWLGTNTYIKTNPGLSAVLAAGNWTGAQFITGDTTQGSGDGAVLSLSSAGVWLGNTNWSSWFGVDANGTWATNFNAAGVGFLLGATGGGGLFLGRGSSEAIFFGNNGVIDVRGGIGYPAGAGNDTPGNGGTLSARGGTPYSSDGGSGGNGGVVSVNGGDFSGGTSGNGGNFLGDGGRDYYNYVPPEGYVVFNGGNGGTVDVRGEGATEFGDGRSGGNIITRYGGGSIDTEAGYIELGTNGVRVTIETAVGSNAVVAVTHGGTLATLADIAASALSTNGSYPGMSVGSATFAANAGALGGSNAASWSSAISAVSNYAAGALLSKLDTSGVRYVDASGVVQPMTNGTTIPSPVSNLAVRLIFDGVHTNVGHYDPATRDVSVVISNLSVSDVSFLGINTNGNISGIAGNGITNAAPALLVNGNMVMVPGSNRVWGLFGLGTGQTNWTLFGDYNHSFMSVRGSEQDMWTFYEGVLLRTGGFDMSTGVRKPPLTLQARHDNYFTNDILWMQSGDGVTRAVFRENGALGLGTTNPAAMLDVVGGAVIRSNVTVLGQLFVGGTSTTPSNAVSYGQMISAGDLRWLPIAYSNYVAATYLSGGQSYTIITNAPWLTAETDWHFASWLSTNTYLKVNPTLAAVLAAGNSTGGTPILLPPDSSTSTPIWFVTARKDNPIKTNYFYAIDQDGGLGVVWSWFDAADPGTKYSFWDSRNLTNAAQLGGTTSADLAGYLPLNSAKYVDALGTTNLITTNTVIVGGDANALTNITATAPLQVIISNRTAALSAPNVLTNGADVYLHSITLTNTANGRSGAITQWSDVASFLAPPANTNLALNLTGTVLEGDGLLNFQVDFSTSGNFGSIAASFFSQTNAAPFQFWDGSSFRAFPTNGLSAQYRDMQYGCVSLVWSNASSVSNYYVRVRSWDGTAWSPYRGMLYGTTMSSPPTLFSYTPTANFSSTDGNITNGGVVTFTDTSTGAITNRLWDFGDGSTTQLLSAAVLSHTYTNAPATNTVSLTVAGPFGQSTKTDTGLVIVAAPSQSIGSFIFDGQNAIEVSAGDPLEEAGTGNFTIEWFQKFESGTGYIMGSWPASDVGWEATGRGQFYCAGLVNNWIFTGNINPSTNWVHVAIVFNGTSIVKYVNGVSNEVAQATGSKGTTGDPPQTFYIGRRSDGGDACQLSMLRISSTARYTSNFVPATTEPEVDQYTIAQWPFSQDGETQLDSAGAFNGIKTGDPTPTWSTDHPIVYAPPLGSMVFNNSANSRIHVESFPDQPNTGTYEAWFKTDTINGDIFAQGIIDRLAEGNGGRRNDIVLITNEIFGVYQSTTSWFDDTQPIPGREAYMYVNSTGWHHVALVITTTNATLFLDGFACKSLPRGGGSNTNDYGLKIGDQSDYGDNDYSFNGNITGVRISDVARYWTDFTPNVSSSTQLDGNTKLLFLFSDQNATSAIDSTGNNNGTFIYEPTWSAEHP